MSKKKVVQPALRRIPLARLRPHPRNSNVMDAKTMVKLERNIRRSGIYPPLIVRQLTGDVLALEPGRDIGILDGHQRRVVFERIGLTEADCYDFGPISEREADVLMATLNTLRGEEDPLRRAELIDELARSIPIEQLAEILPEGMEEIEDALRLLEVDFEHLEVAARTAAEASEAETPRVFTVLLFPAQEAVVRQALATVKKVGDLGAVRNPDGAALEFLAADYLAGAPQSGDPEG